MGHSDRSSRATLVTLVCQRPRASRAPWPMASPATGSPPCGTKCFRCLDGCPSAFPSPHSPSMLRTQQHPMGCFTAASSDRNSGTATATLLGPVTGWHRDAPSLTTPRPGSPNGHALRGLKIEGGRDVFWTAQRRDVRTRRACGTMVCGKHSGQYCLCAGQRHLGRF